MLRAEAHIREERGDPLASFRPGRPDPVDHEHLFDGRSDRDPRVEAGVGILEHDLDPLPEAAQLRAALEKSSASASTSRSDLAAVLRQAGGEPFPASFADPKTLEEDILRLLTDAEEAPTRLLTQFRDSIKVRSNPDGMDPVRRAILDHEIRMRTRRRG